MRKKLNKLRRKLTKNPNNHFLRGQYFNLKRRYKATCKKGETEISEEITTKSRKFIHL